MKPGVSFLYSYLDHSLSPGTTLDFGMRGITFVAHMSTSQLCNLPSSPDVQSREFWYAGEREKKSAQGS
jgi:hypothetical protein